MGAIITGVIKQLPKPIFTQHMFAMLRAQVSRLKKVGQLLCVELFHNRYSSHAQSVNSPLCRGKMSFDEERARPRSFRGLSNLKRMYHDIDPAPI